MPALNCTNPVVFSFSRPGIDFTVELAWDGTSTPPNCDGVVSRVVWANTTDVVLPSRTFYAHLPATRLGPAVYQLVAGSTGNVTNRTILHAAGLDSRSDLIAGPLGLDLNEVPPQAGELLINP